MSIALVLALAAAGAWVWLLHFNGGFWRADQRLADSPSGPGPCPPVVAVIPARNEAEGIGETVAAHMRTGYPGPYRVVLVDDASTDGTAEIARRAAEEHPIPLDIVEAPPLEPGWTGKLWALNSGLKAARRLAPDAKYVLLMDADIVPGGAVLGDLVAKAHKDGLSLVSLMALLDARGFWAGLLIPAFVYFFQKLYPFARVNDPKSSVAGAAGGCVLLDLAALEGEGGIAAIKGALIDDCTLARLIKGCPPKRAIWLGLTRDVRSLRNNERLEDIWSMVARTAYTQLRYSPLLLAGTLLGLALVYLAAPLLVLTWPVHGDFLAAAIGAGTWAAMAWSFGPTLALYGKSPALGVLLPLAGLLYGGMTFSSALRHWRGEGGRWKGRTYPASMPTSGGAFESRRK